MNVETTSRLRRLHEPRSVDFKLFARTFHAIGTGGLHAAVGANGRLHNLRRYLRTDLRWPSHCDKNTTSEGVLPQSIIVIRHITASNQILVAWTARIISALGYRHLIFRDADAGPNNSIPPCFRSGLHRQKCRAGPASGSIDRTR